MSRKPESTLISSIHKELRKDSNPPHFEKMHNPYRGGTADVWYSGDKGDLWVEYKWIPKLPTSGPVKPDLSQLQLEWLISRAEEGRNVVVAVGCPDGLIITSLPSQWIYGIPPEVGCTRKEFARLLKEVVGSCKSSRDYLVRQSP